MRVKVKVGKGLKREHSPRLKESPPISTIGADGWNENVGTSEMNLESSRHKSSTPLQRLEGRVKCSSRTVQSGGSEGTAETTDWLLALVQKKPKDEPNNFN